MRSLNKKIHKFMKKEYRQIKTTTLYRIIETLENRNRSPSHEPDAFELSRSTYSNTQPSKITFIDMILPTLQTAKT